MDTSLLNNWHALVDGRADFDKCQFITLFKEHGQPHKVAVTWRWRLGGAYLHLGENAGSPSGSKH